PVENKKKGKTMATVTEAVAPPAFDWKRWPDTEAVVDGLIAAALEGNAFARRLAERMPGETGTRFSGGGDHLGLNEFPGLARQLDGLGYERQAIRYAVNAPVFAHPGGMFPRIAILSATGDEPPGEGPHVQEVAIKVDSVAAFSRAHDLGLEIVGH